MRALFVVQNHRSARHVDAILDTCRSPHQVVHLRKRVSLDLDEPVKLSVRHALGSVMKIPIGQVLRALGVLF